MNAERWQQVREVMESAAALAAVERHQYLDQACAGDSELRNEVESLLHSLDQAGSQFLGTPAAQLLKPQIETAVSSRIGSRIGVYQVLEEIGRGGMGEVFRAARADGQYRKEVALKLVRGGLDSDSVLRRFRHERQILAGLDHPNIAHLLDGGTTEDGIPYLAMELIEGTPIDAYCDSRTLNIGERLHLFRQVCTAVQYAHQRLVIHRDLKPSNILVTADGVPKLLDFGIAKILDPAAGAETTLAHPMTPEYASPEQIRGETITTASDVYSLGVVLYQLLTGYSPYGVKTSTPHRLAQAICETEPTRPSSLVQNQGTPELVTRMGEGSLAKLRRHLAGDLDNIVLKALRKEPERRYGSVEQFAEDIRRYQEKLPVTARRGSWNYRAGKFIRRNRMGMAATALVLLVLIGGIVSTVREARIARAERARAEQRFNDVRKLANSLIFEIHDSIQGLPGATPSRKLLLDRAVQYLDKLSQDAAGDVNLQRELAWAYHRLATVQGDTTQSNLGQVAAAEISNQKSMALFEAVARANPNSLTDQLNLAMAYRWRAFRDIYEPTGLAEINRALAVTQPLARTHKGSLDLKNELAQEYYILAQIQDAIGDRLQAIDSFRRVLDLRQEIFRTNPAYPDIRRGMAKVMVLLGHELGRFGSRDEGLRLLSDGISAFEALVQETRGDPTIVREVSAALGRRVEVELMQGDVAAAHADLRHSLQPLERLAKLDPENKMLQSDVWVARFQDGRSLAFAGHYAEALPVLQGAFQGYLSLHLEEDVGPGPPAMQAWIGEAQAGTQHFAQALQSYEAARVGLAEDQSHYDDARCDLAMVETKIGNVLLRMRKGREASVHYEKALETSRLSTSMKHNDFPALYAASEAYAGVGDVAVLQARTTSDPKVRSKWWQEACTSYASSLAVLKYIPNPSPLSSNGYRVRTPGAIMRQLALCQAGPEQ